MLQTLSNPPQRIHERSSLNAMQRPRAVMLSRVADAVFWMSRQLERAEHIARMVDVCFHMDLDLRGVTAGPRELHWTSLLAILQADTPPSGSNGSFKTAISHWLTFDIQNPNSIMTCITRARNNARSVRGTINSEMWKELNKLYWQLSDPDFCSRAQQSPHEFYQAVECGSHLFQGVCDATLTRDEAWQFIQLGKFLERTGKTLRILNVQYHLLQSLTNPSDVSLGHLQWAGVLKSCKAYQAYQGLYVGRVERQQVLEFLLMHPTFPRSVRFCLESAAASLVEIEGQLPGRIVSEAARMLGQMLNELKFGDIAEILNGDFHAFLSSILNRCNSVSRALQNQYSLQ